MCPPPSCDTLCSTHTPAQIFPYGFRHPSGPTIRGETYHNVVKSVAGQYFAWVNPRPNCAFLRRFDFVLGNGQYRCGRHWLTRCLLLRGVVRRTVAAAAAPADAALVNAPPPVTYIPAPPAAHSPHLLRREPPRPHPLPVHHNSSHPGKHIIYQNTFLDLNLLGRQLDSMFAAAGIKLMPRYRARRG